MVSNSNVNGKIVCDLLVSAYPKEAVEGGWLTGGQPTSAEFFQRFIDERRGGIITALGEDKETVGMIAMGYMSKAHDFRGEPGFRKLGFRRSQIAPMFFLFWFAVNPLCQGKGVGGKLLDATIAQCEEHRRAALEGKGSLKAEAISALVLKDSAPRSYSAFQNRGFVPVLSFEDDLFGTNYLMQKVLH